MGIVQDVVPETPRDPASTHPTPAVAPGPSRREQWIEITVVLLVLWLPTVLNALFYPTTPESEAESHSARSSVYSACKHVGGIVLILFLARRSGQGWSSLGMRRLRLLDLAAAILIAGAYRMVDRFISLVTYFSGLRYLLNSLVPPPATQFVPPWGSEALWVIPTLLLTVTYEEVLYRGYLSTRLRPLLGTFGAVLLSSLAFGLPHVYQGGARIVEVAAGGCVLAAILRLGRLLWVLALAHFLFDLGVLGYFAFLTS